MIGWLFAGIVALLLEGDDQPERQPWTVGGTIVMLLGAAFTLGLGYIIVDFVGSLR